MKKELTVEHVGSGSEKYEMGSLWVSPRGMVFMLVESSTGFAAVNLEGENTWRGWHTQPAAAVGGLARVSVGTIIRLEVKQDD